jgi:hypothetical protein
VSLTTYKKQKLPESYKALEKAGFTLQVIILKDKTKTAGSSKNKKRSGGCIL